jgi:hypothetical protein
LAPQVQQGINGGGSALLTPFFFDRLLHEAGDHGAPILIRKGFLEGLLDLLRDAEIDGCHHQSPLLKSSTTS